MKSISQIKEILLLEKDILSTEYGMKEIGLFGSYVRGEETKDSDIDLLVQLEKPPKIDLFKFIEIEQALSEKFECKVDLVIKDDLNLVYEIIY